jgi:hypothetical protein
MKQREQAIAGGDDELPVVVNRSINGTRWCQERRGRDAKRNSTAENAWAGSVPFAGQLVKAGRHGKREARLGIESSAV